MEFTDEHHKYFNYLDEKIIPALREANDPKLEFALDNLEANMAKVKSGAIDAKTYVQWTKHDCQSVIDAAPEGTEGVDWIKQVQGEIGTFFGVEIEEADVRAMLAEKAKGTEYDWEKSIVDLLKLLEKESSLSARKEYAQALGYPEEKMDKAGSAEFNIWLHGQILNVLAMNGGQWPE